MNKGFSVKNFGQDQGMTSCFECFWMKEFVDENEGGDVGQGQTVESCECYYFVYEEFGLFFFFLILEEG